MTRRRRILLATALLGCALAFLHILAPQRVHLLTLPPGPRTPSISLGQFHGLVLAPDGSLWCWGGEERGWPVLGQGKTSFSPDLIRIGLETNWVRISAGSDHNLALKSDGTVWSWGGNYKGQLGPGLDPTGMATNRIVPLEKTPVRRLAGNDWVQIIAGYAASFGLKRDGTLWAWGLNNFGQLGIGSLISSILPVQVGNATNWIKICEGGVSAAGIQSDGSLWIWGGSPQLGNRAPGSTQNLLVPTRFGSNTNWADVSVAFNLWLGIKSDGSLWAWGRIAHQFTGDAPDNFDTPTRIGRDSDWASVYSSDGGFYHLLRRRDGSFWILDLTGRTSGSMRLTRLDLPDDIVAFEARGRAAAFITSGGAIWTCGQVLGQPSGRDRAMRLLDGAWVRFGLRPRWSSDPNPVNRPQPWQLRLSDRTRPQQNPPNP